MDGSSLAGIFIGNFFRFDIIIFIAALANFWCYLLVRRSTNRLYNKMHFTIFIPAHDPYNQASQNIFSISESDVIIMRKKAGAFYSVFTTLTSIFTLFGILGTVLSLIPVIGQSESIKTNFFVSLTSTFWGIVFAIIFKILDAFISGKIEDNEKTVALYLDRNAKAMADHK
jgi:biopolymer transport protein ExbB